MEEVIHDGLNVINSGGRNELEDPKSVNAGKSQSSKISQQQNGKKGLLLKGEIKDDGSRSHCSSLDATAHPDGNIVHCL